MQRGDEQGTGNIQKGRAAGAPELFSKRVLNWAMRIWRPAGTVVAVGLALLLAWHVVNGKHGLSVWQQKRIEYKQLRKENQDLEQENARIREHVEKLKSDPHAIEREAREKLHYAKPGEVIYALPPEPPEETPPAVNQMRRAVAAAEPFPKRVLGWALRMWRPAGAVMAVGLALLLTWHVVNRKHGLSVSQQKQVEDRQLREKLHHAKSGEVNLFASARPARADSAGE
jgi:cell division protein FtsB